MTAYTLFLIPPSPPFLFSSCYYIAEFCLVHLLLARNPNTFFQHLIECIFHFNGYEKHRGTCMWDGNGGMWYDHCSLAIQCIISSNRLRERRSCSIWRVANIVAREWRSTRFSYHTWRTRKGFSSLPNSARRCVRMCVCVTVCVTVCVCNSIYNIYIFVVCACVYKSSPTVQLNVDPICSLFSSLGGKHTTCKCKIRTRSLS